MLITLLSFILCVNAKIFHYLAVAMFKLIIFEGTCSAVRRRYVISPGRAAQSDPLRYSSAK